MIVRSLGRMENHSVTRPTASSPSVSLRPPSLSARLPLSSRRSRASRRTRRRQGTRHRARSCCARHPLIQAGKGDEATFWFYAGQLRWRSRLRADPDQDPSGEPALFSSLFETLGPAVNGWAFGDIPKLQQTIDTVLLWDQRYPDTSLDPVVHKRTRAGLTDLRDQIGREADAIRAERASRGLENR